MGFDCATVCMLALEPVCYCRCGGINHGRKKLEPNPFVGYFCEDCGVPFGTSVKSVWKRGCYMQYACSQKYKNRWGSATAAYYCSRCSLKRFPKDAERVAEYLDWLRRFAPDLAAAYA